MPIDSIDHFTLERSAAGETGPWPTMWTIADKTTTTAPFTVPDKTLPTPDVTVDVVDASWIAVNEYVNVTLAGLFKVVGKNGNQIALRYLNESYNTRSGELIASGSQVLPGSTIDTDVPSPTFWYKLTGYTVNGITIPYNVMSVTNTVVADGAWKWQRIFAGQDTGTQTFPQAVATDKRTGIPDSNSVVVVGNTKGRVDFGGQILTTAGGGADFFIAKYTSANVRRWSRIFGGSGLNVSDSGTGVAIDASGNIFVTGLFRGTMTMDAFTLISGGDADVFLAKFDPEGNCLNAVRFAATGTDQGTSLALDSSGNVFITGLYGYFGTAPDFGGGPLSLHGDMDIFVAKFNNSLTHIWSIGFGGTGTDIGQSLAVDTGGNAIVAGQFAGTVDFGGVTKISAGGSDIFVAKYAAANGALVWVNAYGNSLAQNAFGVAADSSSNVFVTGVMKGTIDFGGGDRAGTFSTVGAIFLLKLTSAGIHDKSFVWGISTTVDETGRCVTVDALNNVILTGSIAAEEDFGGGPLIVSGSGGYNVFVAKFNNSLTHTWSKAAGGIVADHGQAVTTDTMGNVFSVGDFQYTINFGGPDATAIGGIINGFLVKYGP